MKTQTGRCKWREQRGMRRRKSLVYDANEQHSEARISKFKYITKSRHCKIAQDPRGKSAQTIHTSIQSNPGLSQTSTLTTPPTPETPPSPRSPPSPPYAPAFQSGCLGNLVLLPLLLCGSVPLHLGHLKSGDPSAARPCSTNSYPGLCMSRVIW